MSGKDPVDVTDATPEVESDPTLEPADGGVSLDATPSSSDVGGDVVSAAAAQDSPDSGENEPILRGATTTVIVSEEKQAPVAKKNLKTFRCVIRALRITNGTKFDAPVIKFELGGNFKRIDNRHRGGELDIVGKRGKRFSTEVLKDFRDKHSDGKFSKWFVKHWTGEYSDLKEQNLSITLEDWKRCCGNTVLGEAKINLYDLAIGNIQQCIELELHETSGKSGRSKHLVAGQLTFLCYFQEVFDYKLHFYDWKGKNLIAADSNGTSDPYVQFKLPKYFRQFFVKGDFGRQDMSKMFSGAYYGRVCQSHHIMNTLFPRWDEVGTLSFHGIRSELENAELLVKVWDWDRADPDDIIGEAAIPLRGLLDYGYLNTGLRLVSDERIHLPNGEQAIQKKIEPAGSLEGFVEVEKLPAHEQYGDQFELLEGHRYLAVHINNCANLMGTDKNGLSDAFVVVEWNGMKQQTSVQRQTLSPAFEETLYFPVRVVSEDAETFASLNLVRVNVFDWDEAGNDFIGGCQFSLSDITSSPVEKHGAKKARTFKASSMKLKTQGETRKQSVISLTSWFIEDLDESLRIPATIPKKPIIELPAEYLQRNKVWLAALPDRLTNDLNYQISACDETGNIRFLPTYLSPIGPPRELQNPYKCFRLVQCITFESDEDVFNGVDDVWANPNFFLSQLKGDQEEHCILLMNLFLGLELDAYVCIGTTKSGLSHTWVMTRDYDGSITFWECTNGKVYTLKKRWIGDPDKLLEIKKSKMNEKELAEYEKNAKALEKQQQKAMKKKLKKVKKNADAVTVSVFDDDDVLDQDDIEEANAETSLQVTGGVRQQAATLPSASTSAALVVASEDVDDYDLGLSKEFLPYHSISVVFNHSNLWGNAQHMDPSKIMYDISNKFQWSPFCSGASKFTPELKPFYNPSRLTRKMPLGRVEALMETIEVDIYGAFMNWRHGKNMPKTHFRKEFGPVLREGLCLMEQLKTADKTLYLIEDKKKAEENASATPNDDVETEAAVTPPVASTSTSTPATTPATTSATTSTSTSTSTPATTSSSETSETGTETSTTTPTETPAETETDSNDAVSLDASSVPLGNLKPSKSTDSATELSPTTSDGPDNDEEVDPNISTKVAAAPKKTHTSDYEQLSLQLAAWKGKLTKMVGPGFKFTGVPISFCYTDHKRIRTHIMDKYDFHTENDEKVEFVTGAHVTPYYHSINAVWVFIGKIVPS